MSDISPKLFNELTWCDPILETTTKILLKKLRWLFGRFEDAKIDFRD